jgi:hypothetical protein
VIVEEPPEPSDIIWENMGSSSFQKILTRVFTYALSLAILTASFFAILYIKKYQIEKVHPLIGAWKKYLSSACIFLVVAFVNAVLHFSLRKISSREMYSTLTGYNSAVARRLSTAKWANSCLVLVMANYMVHGGELKNQIGAPGGLIYDVFFVVAGSAILTPILKLFRLSHFYRCLKKRSIRNAGVLSKITQQEANYWFENPGMDLATDYSMYSNLVMMGIFFMFIFPLGLFISLVGVCLLNMIDKYLLLRRYSLPQATSAQLIYNIL